jgi:hypothetical protein
VQPIELGILRGNQNNITLLHYSMKKAWKCGGAVNNYWYQNN